MKNCTASSVIFQRLRLSVKLRNAVVTGTALYILPAARALTMNTTISNAVRNSVPLPVKSELTGADSSVSIEPLQAYISAAASIIASTICSRVSAMVMPNMLRGMAP